jgi:hypothetical protein|tara:strand:+ start:504 stop:641 length:138 start_codon:yes stop_codon:yes gene_type:complete
MSNLKDFLKDMGLEGVHPKDTTRKPEYMNPGFYIDPRDSNGEVPF